MGKTESFEFLNELALAFRRGEKNARPQHAPILEGIRAVLAHLNASGRLIPAGGMALTAEQVEDVRLLAASVMKTNRGAAFEARDRLRALFPATEPAEDAVGDPLQAWKEFLKPKPIGWYSTMTREFATEHFGFPEVTGLLECTHTASDGGTWGWCGGDWELLAYPPAPAEPAEEETKAERPVHDSWCTGTHGRAGNCIDTSRWIDPPIATAETHMDKMVRKGSIAKFLERTLVAGDGWHLPTGWDPGVLAGAIVYGVTDASSPVVPAPAEASVIGNAAVALRSAMALLDPHEGGDWEHAWRTIGDLADCASRAYAATPAETGWPTWQEVPEGMTVKAKNRHTYTKRDGILCIGTSTMKSCMATSTHHLAPFVAAEEGDA